MDVPKELLPVTGSQRGTSSMQQCAPPMPLMHKTRAQANWATLKRKNDLVRAICFS